MCSGPGRIATACCSRCAHPGGFRLYSEAARATLGGDASTSLGYLAGPRLTASAGSEPSARLRQATDAFDEPAAQAVLDRLLADLSLPAVLRDVVLPTSLTEHSDESGKAGRPACHDFPSTPILRTGLQVARHRQDAAVQPLPAAGQRSRALASLTQRFTAATALPDEVLRAIVRHQIQEIAGPAPRRYRATYRPCRVPGQHVTGISSPDHHDGQLASAISRRRSPAVLPAPPSRRSRAQGRWSVARAPVTGWTDGDRGPQADAEERTRSVHRAIEIREKRRRVLSSRLVWITLRCSRR